jgi:hypothetical protein
MKPTRMRLVGVAAALSTIAIAIPVSSASADSTVPGGAAAWDGPTVTLPATGPLAGQLATVIGPAVITTAPATFINTNNQVSAGDIWSGGQLAQ